MAESKIYRAYANNYVSFESLKTVSGWQEIHVVLCFARDYDNTGNFCPYFDTDTVTPQVIADFKKNSLVPVKFFLSIGGRDPRCPFSLPAAVLGEWVQNAVDSLTRIITSYNLDGIDVYYEYINPDARDQFVNGLAQVIQSLRTRKSAAIYISITISIRVIVDYLLLYEACMEYIGYIILQGFTSVEPIGTIANVRALITRDIGKVALLFGQSILPTDWTNFTLPFILLNIPEILRYFSGISLFTVISG